MRCSFLWLMVMSCTLLHARDIHVAVCGNDANAGTVEAPYRTVSKAACEACPGDVITVHAGTYREWVRPLRGGGTNNDNRIIYQAAKGEKVVISGSEPVEGWEKVKNNTWKLIIANDYWEGTNPFDEQIYGSWYYGEGTPNHTGAVLLNGIPMGEAFSREEILKPIQGRARWYAETGGNGGPIVMNIGNVWPDGGKKVTPQQASVENGDQAVYVSNSCIQFGYLKDGSVMHYENVDFGEGAETLYLEIASLAKGGKVEMHMDNPDGELLGEYQMKSSTTDWLKFKEFPIKMNRLLVGRQNFCLVVRAVETDSCTPTIVWAQFPDGVNPNDGSVEMYVRPQVFYPEHTGVDYITVRGFILENAATNWAPPSAEQPALIGPRWAKGWVIENNVIRNSRCSGISLGRSTFGHAHHYQNMPPRGIC